VYPVGLPVDEPDRHPHGLQQPGQDEARRTGPDDENVELLTARVP
jgi:hypothetical protein